MSDKTKQPKLKKDGKVDKRSFNKPPKANLETARLRLRYLMDTGAENAGKKKNKPKQDQQNEGVEIEPSMEEKRPNRKDYKQLETTDEEPEQQPRINKNKKKRTKVIVESEEEGQSPYEIETESETEEEDSEPELILTKRKTTRREPKRKVKYEKRKPKRVNNPLPVYVEQRHSMNDKNNDLLLEKLNKMEQMMNEKQVEKEMAMQSIKKNNDLTQDFRRKMLNGIKW